MMRRWLAGRRLRPIPLVSAHRPALARLWLGGLLMAALGLSLPLVLAEGSEEGQSLERKRLELEAQLTRERRALQQMQAALEMAAEPAPPASAAFDRLMLHRLALAQGLRVQALKSDEPAAASSGTRLELGGPFGALRAFLQTMARSEVAWGLKEMRLSAGEQGHRLSLRLQALPLGPWMQGLGPSGPLARSLGPDPFAAPTVASMTPPASADPLAGMPAQWRAEFSRERQPLEALALGELFFTGTFRQGSAWVALIRSGRVVHTVKVGDYLGPDWGRVQAVDQDGLDLRELKRNGQGLWSEQLRRWAVGAAP